MKIRKVETNNRKKAFQLTTFNGSTYLFPYAKLDVAPTKHDVIREVYVDPELDKEAFTYVLDSGKEGSIHMDHVLEYNRDPGYLENELLYRLTLEAQKRAEKSPLSKREIIRRLGTSASQFYRLLDQTNTNKSIKQLLGLLYILDCKVDFEITERELA